MTRVESLPVRTTAASCDAAIASEQTRSDAAMDVERRKRLDKLMFSPIRDLSGFFVEYKTNAPDATMATWSAFQLPKPLPGKLSAVYSLSPRYAVFEEKASKLDHWLFTARRGDRD